MLCPHSFPQVPGCDCIVAGDVDLTIYRKAAQIEIGATEREQAVVDDHQLAMDVDLSVTLLE
ncbi:hypothetical protein D3C71_1988170 [compost metagenome]